MFPAASQGTRGAQFWGRGPKSAAGCDLCVRGDGQAGPSGDLAMRVFLWVPAGACGPWSERLRPQNWAPWSCWAGPCPSAMAPSAAPLSRRTGRAPGRRRASARVQSTSTLGPGPAWPEAPPLPTSQDGGVPGPWCLAFLTDPPPWAAPGTPGALGTPAACPPRGLA